MGNKFHQFADSNLPFIQSISIHQIQQKPLQFFIQTPIQSRRTIQTLSLNSNKMVEQLSSVPATPHKKQSQPSKQQSTTNSNNTKTINQRQQEMALKMIVGVMKKKKIIGGFKIAKQDIIEKYNNPEIKDITQPLIIDSAIVNIPYEEKNNPYYIKLERLPCSGYKMPSSWVYLGQWFQDFPHGIGKMYHPTFKYQGYFHRGIPHLKGRRVTVDQIYEGDIVMNKRQGFGRLVTKSEYYYEGNWDDDIRQGEGYEIHRNGCVFQGQYVKDKVSVGSLYIPLPEIRKKLNYLQNYAYLNLIRTQFKQKYYGEFENNKFEGKGDYIWSDGRSYQGNWKNGKMYGQGCFIWGNGKRYEGGYVNNKKHGYGKFYSFSKTYEGFWEYGKPHGKGKITKGDQVQYKIWHHGQVIRQDNDYEVISLMSGEQEKFPEQISARLSEYQLQSISSRQLL